MQQKRQAPNKLLLAVLAVAVVAALVLVVVPRLGGGGQDADPVDRADVPNTAVETPESDHEFVCVNVADITEDFAACVPAEIAHPPRDPFAF